MDSGLVVGELEQAVPLGWVGAAHTVGRERSEVARRLCADFVGVGLGGQRIDGIRRGAQDGAQLGDDRAQIEAPGHAGRRALVLVAGPRHQLVEKP